MLTRSRETTVTFVREFSLRGVDGAQPGGTYRVVTDEEEILGISHLAFRRVATALHTPAVPDTCPAAESWPSVSRSTQVFPVDPNDLEAALRADRDR
jgi:hypothetical protein